MRSELKFDPIERSRNLNLDSILGEPFGVLDDGFFRVIDYMGGDASVVRAARVSYGAGTKTVSEDSQLIRYLMRHQHTTPFEGPKITFHVRVPMDVWRQWVRHRMMNVSEASTRYSVAIDSAMVTTDDQWRLQSKDKKQGSGDYLVEWPELKGLRREASEDAPNGAWYRDIYYNSPGCYLGDQEDELQSQARATYEERLKFGVAREQARKDLPLSTYTEAYVTWDLKNLLDFLALRMDEHAQWEIRQYANEIARIVKLWVPMTWAAFGDYRLNAMKLSARDVAMLQKILEWDSFVGPTAIAICQEEIDKLKEGFGWDKEKSTERKEFEAKAKRLGVELPWDS